MAHKQDTLCFRINSAHLWSDVWAFDRYCCYVFPFLDNTVETEAQEGHNGIRCEICFIFVTFQMCEGPYWGEVSLFRDFQLSFNPKYCDNPLKSATRSWISAQCGLAFHSGVLFAKPLHSKSAAFVLSSGRPWQPSSCWDLNWCFFILSTPNWRATSKPSLLHLKFGCLVSVLFLLISQIKFLLTIFGSWAAHSKSPKDLQAHYLAWLWALVLAPVAFKDCADNSCGAACQMSCCRAVRKTAARPLDWRWNILLCAPEDKWK